MIGIVSYEELSIFRSGMNPVLALLMVPNIYSYSLLHIVRPDTRPDPIGYCSTRPGTRDFNTRSVFAILTVGKYMKCEEYHDYHRTISQSKNHLTLEFEITILPCHKIPKNAAAFLSVDNLGRWKWFEVSWRNGSSFIWGNGSRPVRNKRGNSSRVNINFKQSGMSYHFTKRWLKWLHKICWTKFLAV